MPRGSRDAGQELLDHWGLDISHCRTELDDVVVERIILDAPADKSLGTVILQAETYIGVSEWRN